MTIAKRLREARALLAKPRGWGKGMNHHPDTGAYCANGAIVATGHHSPKAIRLLGLAIKEVDPNYETKYGEKPGDVSFITYWNDRKIRRKAQVLAAFDKAIELAEAKAAAKLDLAGKNISIV